LTAFQRDASSLRGPGGRDSRKNSETVPKVYLIEHKQKTDKKNLKKRKATVTDQGKLYLEKRYLAKKKSLKKSVETRILHLRKKKKADERISSSGTKKGGTLRKRTSDLGKGRFSLKLFRKRDFGSSRGGQKRLMLNL